MIDEAAIVILSIIGSEVMATVTHRYIMHGPYGWILHRDHHENHDGVFERNDLFAVFFASVAIFMMWLAAPWSSLFWMGTGITIYGLLYFLVHDGLGSVDIRTEGDSRGGWNLIQG